LNKNRSIAIKNILILVINFKANSLKILMKKLVTITTKVKRRKNVKRRRY